MRATQQWFYASGPEGEMAVENNQSAFAEQHQIPQTKISACLRKSLKQYKGWVFQWVGEPGPKDRITPLEFRTLHARTGLDTAGMSAALERAESTILQYRTGFLPCPGKIADKLRVLAAKGNQAEKKTDHCEAAITARIQHLMENLYPQWGGIDSDGAIFTNQGRTSP